jgi:methionyl-tRNA formyltransferase
LGNRTNQNILFLGDKDSPLLEWLKRHEKSIIHTSEKITPEFIISNRIELLVSYGYRHILRENVLKLLPNSAINLHISYLPWNRGSDPNLWSILENSPKGITIHFIDEGVDTGDVLFQKQIDFELDDHTLRSSYYLLQKEMQQLFKDHWHEIKSGKFQPIKQSKGGSHHYKKDFKLIVDMLLDIHGWDIPLEILLRNYREVKKYESYT